MSISNKRKMNLRKLEELVEINRQEVTQAYRYYDRVLMRCGEILQLSYEIEGIRITFDDALLLVTLFGKASMEAPFEYNASCGLVVDFDKSHKRKLLKAAANNSQLKRDIAFRDIVSEMMKIHHSKREGETKNKIKKKKIEI